MGFYAVVFFSHFNLNISSFAINLKFSSVKKKIAKTFIIYQTLITFAIFKKNIAKNNVSLVFFSRLQCSTRFESLAR